MFEHYECLRQWYMQCTTSIQFSAHIVKVRYLVILFTIIQLFKFYCNFKSKELILQIYLNALVQLEAINHNLILALINVLTKN